MKNQYNLLLKDIRYVASSDSDLISCMANTCALMHKKLQCLWTGFYLVKGNQLVLGPFQGDVACTRIAFDKGVCGKSWAKAKSIIVDDVNSVEGHIACSAEAKSEIVCPVIKNNKVVAVIDLDSNRYSAFGKDHQEFLTAVAELIAKKF